MITPFQMYTVSAIVNLFGVVLFAWWWFRTGRATPVYIYVTLVLFAEFFEKTVIAWLRWLRRYGGADGMETYYAIVGHEYWFLLAVPSLIAFSVLVGAMTLRIISSNQALRREDDSVIPNARKIQKSVLVISIKKSTRSMMKGFFVSNRIGYHEANSIVHGVEILVMDESVSVVLIGLSAIEDAGMTQEQVVKMIKKERPWCFVVALTSTPSIYELYEARRSFFDDYLYLPVRGSVLGSHYQRWIAKVYRWRRIKLEDRRKKDGELKDRKHLKFRRQPKKKE